MRDCVRRFAEAMDKMLDEKEPEKGVCSWCGVHKNVLVADARMQLRKSNGLITDEQFLRSMIHAANLCMMAYDNVVIDG